MAPRIDKDGLVPATDILVADEEAGFGAPDREDLLITDGRGNVLQRPRFSPPPDPETRRELDSELAALAAESRARKAPER